MKTRTVGISAIIFIYCLLTACRPTIADNTTLQPDGSVSDAVIDPVVLPAVETITRRQAVEDIVSLLDEVSSDQSAADYAETHGLLLMLNEPDWDAAISCRDAAVLLYEALSRGTHHFTLETVSNHSHVDSRLRKTAQSERSCFCIGGKSCMASHSRTGMHRFRKMRFMRY